MECFDFDDEVAQFLEPFEREKVPEPVRRQRDPKLLERSHAASAALQTQLRPILQQFERQNPALCAGLQAQLLASFRPKQTPGQSKVLLALIQVILGPKGGDRTQEQCRQLVQAQFPAFAVTKNWTKPLPSWALKHAEKIIVCSGPAHLPLKINRGATLNDLHAAAKTMLHRGGEGVLTFRAVVAVAGNCVTINGHSFKRSVNHSNGREYPIVRMNVPALVQALQSKPKIT